MYLLTCKNIDTYRIVWYTQKSKYGKEKRKFNEYYQ